MFSHHCVRPSCFSADHWHSRAQPKDGKGQSPRAGEGAGQADQAMDPLHRLRRLDRKDGFRRWTLVLSVRSSTLF